LPLFITPPHNVRKTPTKWEVLRGRCEEMFLTMANGL
jgi:hypothetical protein